MSDNVSQFPTNAYAKRLADMERYRSVQSIRECLQYAIANNLGRSPILDYVASHKDEITIYKDEPRRLIEWLADNCEHPDNLKKHHPSDAEKALERNIEYDDFLEDVREMGRAARDKGSTPYRWFTAAWEVDAEIWSNAFGEHDPAMVIAEYADECLMAPARMNICTAQNTHLPTSTSRSLTLAPCPVCGGRKTTSLLDESADKQRPRCFTSLDEAKSKYSTGLD